MNHYQIYLHNEPNPVHAQGDAIETREGFVVVDRDGTVSFACPVNTIRCIFLVDPESLPSKEEFLEQQRELIERRSENKALIVEKKALQIKNNELWEDRREALDAEQDAAAALEKEKKLHKRTCWILAFVCTVEVILAISRALH